MITILLKAMDSRYFFRVNQDSGSKTHDIFFIKLKNVFEKWGMEFWIFAFLVREIMCKEGPVPFPS